LKKYWILIFVLIVIFVLDAKMVLYASDNLSLMKLLRESVIPLNSLADNEHIIKQIGRKPLVLIGDSTHGTHEFYQQRINISKQLIQQKHFKLIVLEGDWPNIYRLNQYVQSSSLLSAEQVLEVDNPDGAWLWHNVEMRDFIVWLKKHNEQLAAGEQKVSLHGMDIYSFSQSREQLINYLQVFSPRAAQQAYQRYRCFSFFNNDLHRYGKAVTRDQSLSCENNVMAQYQDFSECRYPCPDQYKAIDKTEFFYAQQNARIIKNTEKSFRLQYWYGDDTVSWNQRDQHMLESLLASAEYLGQPKTIVWAHNSHLGDARATSMADRGQLNLAQLLRQIFAEQVFSIGMLTYTGTVMAADDWDQPAELKRLLNAHPDSYEALFHQLAVPHFFLNLHQSDELTKMLNQPGLQRHVGVVYRPHDEMDSHYSHSRMADQFDAIIYIDVTTSLILLNNRKM